MLASIYKIFDLLIYCLTITITYKYIFKRFKGGGCILFHRLTQI